jgi:hypothetical protein
MQVWKEETKRRLAGLKLEPTREAAIVEELAQYLDDYYAELLSGGVTSTEAERSQPVVVIDEVLARQYFPNTDPIGKRINLGSDRDPLQIIGVVGHVKQWSLDSDDQQSLRAQLYEPLRQMSGSPSGMDVVVRAEGLSGQYATALYGAIRLVVQSQHSQNVIFGMQTMNQVVADSLSRQRFSMILLNAFAVVALLLANVGLYGVIS